MKTTALVLALMAAAAAAARAQTTLDSAGGTLIVTTRHAGRADVTLRTADGRQTMLEVVPSNAGGGMPIQQVSHTSRGLAVHAGAGGSAPLATALFRYDTAEAPSGPCELRRLARSHLRRVPGGHTLNTTGLVHEAYLTLQLFDAGQESARPRQVTFLGPGVSLFGDLCRPGAPGCP